MPSTVAKLLEAAGLKQAGSVPWGEKVTARGCGVYIVSLSHNLESAPIDLAHIRAWRARATKLRLDGKPGVTAEQLAERIGKFWFKDESILYIGATSVKLHERVGRYYNTPL